MDDEMKKERLKELREEVTRHRAFIDDHAMNTSTEDDVLELIDAEIVRQSATDEAVKDAIAWAEQERKNNIRYMDFGDADSATLAIDALRQYQSPLAIQWTGKNLREVIDLVDLNPSANKWTWEEYEQIVKEKGLKIFTPDGPVMADVGDWIIQNGKDCFVTRQYQKPTDEAVRTAIGWLEAEKESAQNAWERSGSEWRMELGAQVMHDELMASFDLAIQALCQMEIDLYPKAGLDPDAGDWGNGYSRGYADGLQARQMRSEPCEWCDITGDWIYEVAVIRNRRKTHKGEMKNYCPNCGRKLVK